MRSGQWHTFRSKRSDSLRKRRRRRVRLRLRRRTRLREIGLVVLSVAITLSLLELFFRFREPQLEGESPPPIHAESARPSLGSGSFRVLGIGESTMVGEPYDPLSFAEMVAMQLRKAYPSARVESELVARQGASLGSLLVRARQAIASRPSAVVLLAGHNDFLGEIAHHATCKSEDRAYELLRGSALYRFIHARWLRRGIGRSPDFAERTFFDNPIVCSAQWDDTLERYASMVTTLAHDCHEVGVPAVFVFPAGNEVELNPNRSVYRGPEARRAEFAEAYRCGVGALWKGELGGAGRCLSSAAAIDPSFAQLSFERGRLDLARGNRDGARAHFAAAREGDAFPWRALDAQRVALERAASRYGLGFVDGRATLAAASPTGLLDGNVFHDVHHPTLNGYLALARAVVASLEAQRPPGLGPRANVGPLSEAEALARIGFTTRNTFHLFESRIRWFAAFSDVTFDPTTRLFALLDNLSSLRALSAPLAKEVVKPDLERNTLRRLSEALQPYGVDVDSEIARRTPLLTRYAYLPHTDDSPVHLGSVPSFIRLGEGVVADGKADDGGPLMMGGVAQRGFSMLPPGDVGFRLEGKYVRFRVTLAISETGAPNAEAGCKVLGDDRTLFDGPIARSDHARVLDLDVTRVQELHLVCNDGGDGSQEGDHVAWLSPHLEAVK